MRVHALDALVLLERVVRDRLQRHDGGVVHETVEAAGLPVERERLVADGGEVAEIARDEADRRARSGSVQRRRDARAARRVAVVDDDARAGGAQASRHGRAETPGAAGDQDRSSGHVHGYSMRTAVGTIAA